MFKINTLLDIIGAFSPLHNYEYCQLETIARHGDNTTLSTADGGMISCIQIDGLNRVIGDDEVNEAIQVFANLITTMVHATEGGRELDFEFYVNPNDTDKVLDRFMRTQRLTAERLGMDIDDQFEEAKKTLRGVMAYEHAIVYIKTLPKMLVNESAYIKKSVAAVKDLAGANIRIKESQKAWLFSEDLHINHVNAVNEALQKLQFAHFTAEILNLEKLFGMMSTSATGALCEPVRPKMWGDKPVLKFAMGEDPAEASLFNMGFTHLGMQILPSDIKETSSHGIVESNGKFFAPVLVETIPDAPANLVELMSTIPLNMPFKYRCHVTYQPRMSQIAAEILTPFLAFSQKYLNHNQKIREGFEEVQQMTYENKPKANISIICTTWGDTEEQAKSRQNRLQELMRSWGNTTTTLERGNPEEAGISSIAGYSLMNRAPYTLVSAVRAAQLALVLRPAAPYDDGDTMYYTKSGKPFPFSPVSNLHEGYISIELAPTGSGKSVNQNTVNRDQNLRPGMKDLARHVTIDIGVSGKGTVKALRDSLPESEKHKVVYEKVILHPDHSINPLDLQLGLLYPAPLDQGIQSDLIQLLVTGIGQDIQPFMPELVNQTLASAYRQCADPETAKLYKPNVSRDVDDILAQYPETNDENFWGRRKTWNKVKDFLFQNGHLREAKFAGRQSVPLVSELPSYANADESIKSNFGAEGKNLLDTFRLLISNAVREYKILSRPTSVDYDDARYIVLDLNDVTQVEGSRMTAFMYGLCTFVTTREYWMSPDYLPFYSPLYHDYAENHIADIREQKLGITLEEFRRTKGQKNVRSMINRWMAEGRKWDVFVRVVAQLPEHIDAEMVGHATMILIMGSWGKENMRQLMDLVSLTKTEIRELMSGGTHGPKKGGPAFLLKYKTKDRGWCGQLVRLAKSSYELWTTSTTAEDMNLRDYTERLAPNSRMARWALTAAYPSGSAKEAVREKLRSLNNSSAGDDSIYEDMAKNVLENYRRMYLSR